jgi:hypothetical protein
MLQQVGALLLSKPIGVLWLICHLICLLLLLLVRAAARCCCGGAAQSRPVEL